MILWTHYVWDKLEQIRLFWDTVWYPKTLFQERYNIMRKVAFLFIGIVLFLTQNGEAIELKHILDEYGKTQDSFRSFIFKADIVEESDLSFKGSGPKGHYIKYQDVEYRYDGDRFKLICKKWGDISTRNNIPSRSDAPYTSYLWDGEKFVRNSLHSKLGLINKNKKKAKKYGNALAKGAFTWINGYISGNGQRVDAFLTKHAKDVTICEESKIINGAKCYLVEANTPEGDFKIWFDCQHGYNVAKMEISIRPEHSSKFPRMSENVLQIEKFAEVNGVWIPVDGHLKWHNKHVNGDGGSGLKTIKRRDILLNPDHEALGSFLMDDIENGTRMAIVGIPARYIWQDGKLIPNVDKLVMKQIDTEVEKLLKEKINPKYKPYAIIKEPNEVASKQEFKSLTLPMGLTVSELMAKYQVNQNRLQSFITKGESTFEIAGKSSEISREEKTASEFRYDGSRVNHRIRSWNDKIPPCKARYESFLWDGESFIKYRQDSDSDKSSVFISRHNSDKNKMIAKGYKGAALMGICGGDYERIDLIFGKARSISLRDKTDTIGGLECYVIEANTKRGKYKVWIDPAHGYNIARVEVQRNKRNLIHYMEPLKAKMSFSLKNVRFEKIDDVWVPMEADIQQIENNGSKITRWHHKRIEFVLNPDHGALKSFVPDDIPDGTKVKLTGDSKKYEWRKGKPVAVDDE